MPASTKTATTRSRRAAAPPNRTRRFSRGAPPVPQRRFASAFVRKSAMPADSSRNKAIPAAAALLLTGAGALLGRKQTRKRRETAIVTAATTAAPVPAPLPTPPPAAA